MMRICMLAIALCAGAVATAAEPVAKDVEAQLRAAQQRLEQAARQVAELSLRASDVAMGAAVDPAMGIHPGAARRAIIGVQLAPESGKDGVRVVEVSPGGPAAEAGVRADDVIAAVDGQDLRDRSDGPRVLTARIRELAPDARVKLRVVRAGKPRDVVVTTRAAPGPLPFVMALPAIGAMSPMESADFAPFDVRPLGGMELATLTPRLGRYFGSDKGILVVRAPAEARVPLQDGDVILNIDGREPTSAAHATRILRSYQPGERLKLAVLRDRKPLTLEVTLPEPDRRAAQLRPRTLASPPVPAVPPALPAPLPATGAEAAEGDAD